ncbi:DUF91 domain-containing protein [Halobacteriales archaeon QH_8_64_26]|nr:MAG: DUF91 domain-containing protein [Halobacteriales archaeon QH_8_64_26]
MIVSVDRERNELEALDEQGLSSLDVLERQDLQEWIIERPEILNEDLLILTAEYGGFEQTRDRLDLLALDRTGRLVVIELKRETADRTTDLQAIKYASYCATLTPEQTQEVYRDFWNGHRSDSLDPEAVGEAFADFLNETADREVGLTETGWADFALDDRPRITLVAGSFGIEVTSPVVWLIEEYDMDVSCVRGLASYPPRCRRGRASRWAGRGEGRSDRRHRAIDVLLERDVVRAGDTVYFDREQVPDHAEHEWDPEEDFWRATVTGKTGRSDNVEWAHDASEHSFTGLSKKLLSELVDRDPDRPLNGYKYWCREENENSLSTIRRETD